MSTGKRLAKRSILGTKVMVPGPDGKHYPGHIQAVKQSEDGNVRYSVRFEESRRLFDFVEKDVVGPGFSTVASVHLQPGQTVYVTHNQREMSGRVVRHDFFAQDVLITVNNISPENESDETILAKIDDVRLLESRKSARLVNSDTDFSKLADINISMTANDKRRQPHNSGTSSASSAHGGSGRSNAIEVPRSDYVQIAGSRKRRTSENLPDDEEVLSECSAAMLLMKLSCSPHSPNLFSPSSSASASAAATTASTPTKKELPSPSLGSSSGASSFRSATPSPPLSASATDEGIVKDMSTKRMRKMIMYQCTYPGCHEQRLSVDAIESHVRVGHLNRPEELDLSIDDSERDHEEEFYYTETEYEEVIDVEPPQLQVSSAKPAVVAVLADHMDMARPAHEDPGSRAAGVAPARGHQVQVIRRKVHHSAVGGAGAASSSPQQPQSLLSRSLPNQSSMPIAIAPRSTTGSSGSKFILISPPARSPATSISSGEGKSPSKRVRDGKKCRKVYGLEQRDMWCTQCKWKKACARFGAHATEPLPPSSPSSGSSSTSIVQISAPMSVVTTGSSLPSASATTVLTGVKAIKF